MTEPADEELVARIRTGDAAAFETLMRRHLRMAFLIAFAQLGERADAEDVCQEAFVRCWQQIGTCRDPNRVSVWIASIVRNAAHNRRDYLRVRRTESIESAALMASTSRSDALAERGDLRHRLTFALDRLPPVQREIVLLHDLEGWTHVEIAGKLDISDMMSRRHLSDARKKLRALLADLGTLENEDD